MLFFSTKNEWDNNFQSYHHLSFIVTLDKQKTFSRSVGVGIFMNKIHQQIVTNLRGRALLSNPILNKGTAFSQKERDVFGLNGLLPNHIETLEEQCRRALYTFDEEPDGLLRYINLRALQDTNETLFYAMIQRYLKKLLPYIYTPVVGEACIRFSTIFRRARGLFLSWPNREHIKEMLANIEAHPEVIVVTDGDRILGLGDLGMNGLGICIGKLSLYSAVGGFEPSGTLPVILDVGTNNDAMLKGQNYLGWRHPRLDDAKYYDFVEQFITSVHEIWPNVLLQFEDLSAERATTLLKKYRNQICCFNDDIQGTSTVVAAILLSATKRSGKSLKDIKIVLAGAGTAGCGIAKQLGRMFYKVGLSEQEIKDCLYLVDKDGLLTTQSKNIAPFQRKHAQLDDKVSGWKNKEGVITLEQVVKQVKPDVLMGVTGIPGLFTENIVRDMAQYHKNPIILPLSNPIANSEAIPEHLIDWTEGRALIATGSPFDGVAYNERLYPIAQCNNIYVFPALGLGVKISGASIITDNMLDAAAEALATCIPEGTDPWIPLLPFMESILDSVEVVAMAVAKSAVKEQVSTQQFTEKALKERMQNYRWVPEYKEIKAL